MASSASTASSPGPSVSQRGSIRRGSSQLSTSGAAGTRARANSNASSITVNSNLTSTSNNLRPFKARRQPKQHHLGSSAGSRPAAITELAHESLLERVSRPEDVDLLALSHDSISSLFAQFSVREVRQIQETAQSQAALKQQELRSMVGERYRDLLGAADSIVRMRVSSQALLGYLNSAREDCTRHHTQPPFTSRPSLLLVFSQTHSDPFLVVMQSLLDSGTRPDQLLLLLLRLHPRTPSQHITPLPCSSNCSWMLPSTFGGF